MVFYVVPTISMTSAMPDSIQMISIAALSFAIGVLVCLLCGLYLLPALVRAQSGELIRDYSTYVQAAVPMRVIVLDRSSSPIPHLTQHPTAARLGSQNTRVDSASSTSGPNNRTRSQAHQTDVFDQIYAHNLELRQKIASG